MLTEAFFGVFEQRAQQFRKSLKTELAKTKKERRKDQIKNWIKEIKDLETMIKKAEADCVETCQTTCPKCGHCF
jgi:hypothetical protein